jgi:predicted acylesterase/phospholipase RssA
MPRFTTRLVKEVQEPTVTDSLVQKYGAYISRIDGNSVGVLKFRESEDITLAREALRLAAEKQGKDLIIRRPRGVDGVLEFRLRNR